MEYTWPEDRKIDIHLMALIEHTLRNSKFTDMPIRDIESEIADNFPKANLYNFMKSWNQLKREGKIAETRHIKTSHEIIRFYTLSSLTD